MTPQKLPVIFKTGFTGSSSLKPDLPKIQLLMAKIQIPTGSSGWEPEVSKTHRPCQKIPAGRTSPNFRHSFWLTGTFVSEPDLPENLSFVQLAKSLKVSHLKIALWYL